MRANQDDIISRSIYLLRFPLIVLVLYIHSIRLNNSDFHILGAFWNLLTLTICDIAVPLFFAISGYLFFNKLSQLCFSNYWLKLKRRFRTLLIPYMFWNCVVVFSIGIGQLVLPNLFSGQFKQVSDFSIYDWMSMFWNAQGSGKPISFQLWFLRDLMVMCALSPLFYLISRLGRWLSLVGFALLYLSGWSLHVPGFSSVAIAFFGVGATLAMTKVEISKISSRWLFVPFLTTYLLIVVFLQFNMDAQWHDIIHRLGVMFGCVVVVMSALGLTQQGYADCSLLTKSSFFIYCYHGIFILVFSRCITKFKYSINEFGAILIYLLFPVLIVVVGVGLYKLLKQYTPYLLSIISGGR